MGGEPPMKLVYFDNFTLGVLKGDTVVDVSADVKDIPHTGPGDLMNGLIERWNSYKPRLEAGVARGGGGPAPHPLPPTAGRGGARARSTEWRSTTGKTPRVARRRRSTPSTNHLARSSDR